MLSAQQVARYHEDGFVVPDYRIPAAMLEALRFDVEQLVGADVQRRQLTATLFDHDRRFVKYACDPVLLAMVEQLAGPDIALWNMSLFGKPAYCGKQVPWHQDGEYWPIRPMATTRIWIALDASTRSNGCLRYVRGSHKNRLLRRHHEASDRSMLLHYEISDEDIDFSEVVDIELEPGQMSIHDIFMVHSSNANTTAHDRRAIVINYMPTTSLFDHALAARQFAELDIDFDHSRRPLFLVRGIDRCGHNDFHIGHDTSTT